MRTIRRLLSLALLCSLPVFGDLPEHEPSSDLTQALALKQSRRLPEALPLFSAHLATQPDDLETRLNVAHLQRRLGRPTDALATLEPVRRSHADHARVNAELGAAHLYHARTLATGLRALHHARRGRDFLETSARLDPSNHEVHLGLVEFHLEAPRLAGGHPDHALPHAEAAARAAPFEGNLLLGQLLLNHRQFKPALDAALHAALTRPEDPSPHLLTGRIHLAMAATESARAAFTLALNLDPDYAPARNALASLAPKPPTR